MDLRLGETCTALFKFVSFGTAHTFTLPFDADKAIFTNLTKFGGTAGYISESIWYKDGLAEPYALQYQAILDNGVATKYSSLNTTTNGFTQTNLPGGAPEYRALIADVTKTDPVVVETSAPNDFQTSQIIRITDLGSDMPVARGMDQINNGRFMITVIDSTHFSLQDPVTGDNIDGTNFTTYVSGGRVDLESRVISLNNPQVAPYNVVPYLPTPFVYNPVTYQLTAGTAVMGASGDVFRVDLIKFGQVIDLGTFLA